MQIVPCTLVVCLLLVGCEPKEPPPPPVAPPAEDLSHWTVPTLVQPDVQKVQMVKPRQATPAETVHDYVPGGVYKVTVAIDAPLDLILEPGEKVQALIGSDPKPLRQDAGEPVPEGTPPKVQVKERWEYRETMGGVGEQAQPHILLRSVEVGATLGLTIISSKRTYYLDVKSVKVSPVRAVWWRYPGQEDMPAKEREPGLLPDHAQSRLYHVGYTVTASNPPPAFVPRFIVDDGKKMYLVYGEMLLFKTVPLVRAITSQGPAVVNSHQYLNVVILDGLFPRLELRIGPDMKDSHAEVVTITQGTLRTIECPNDPGCPVWPDAAAHLARRTP